MQTALQALQELASSMRGQATLPAGAAATQSSLQQQLSAACKLVQTALAETGDAGPRHIREVHVLDDIRSEFVSLKWSMGANEPLPSWSEHGPPAATAAADAVKRLAMHLQHIRDDRRAAMEDKEARTTLRSSLADAALQRLQGLQRSGTVILPPPRFASPRAVAMEGYWDQATYRPQSFIYPGLTEAWPSKASFLVAVATIEAAICLGEPREIQRAGCADMRGVIPTASFVSMDGQSPSRMEEGYQVGSGEFFDVCEDGGKIGWPEGYAKHYIGEHEVLPTRRFYEYVVWRAGAVKEQR